MCYNMLFCPVKIIGQRELRNDNAVIIAASNRGGIRRHDGGAGGAAGTDHTGSDLHCDRPAKQRLAYARWPRVDAPETSKVMTTCAASGERLVPRYVRRPETAHRGAGIASARADRRPRAARLGRRLAPGDRAEASGAASACARYGCGVRVSRGCRLYEMPGSLFREAQASFPVRHCDPWMPASGRGGAHRRGPGAHLRRAHGRFGDYWACLFSVRLGVPHRRA